mgnify:CR=1 FL=1
MISRENASGKKVKVDRINWVEEKVKIITQVNFETCGSGGDRSCNVDFHLEGILALRRHFCQERFIVPTNSS